MKIITIVGARPQFVKAAVISRVLQNYDEVEEILLHTGQHYDDNMSAIFFDELDIPKPKYHLGVQGGSHGAMTGKMLEQIEAILLTEKPDWVIVYGDTNSTLAGALAAKKLHIKIAHVEAGLRSHNQAMPEEINRILTDRISDVLFCPTQTAMTNLQNEGFNHFLSQSYLIGDVMQDAALYYAEKATMPESVPLEITNKPYALCTIHRQENTDDPQRLTSLIAALNTLNERIKIALVLHPRTKKKLSELGQSLNFPTIEPVGYLNMLGLLKNCQLVLTDSGGLQKEAYFFKKPCITLRDETEWVELVENGFNKIVGVDSKSIFAAYEAFSNEQPTFDVELYGGGKAGEEIVKVLVG